MAFDPYHSWLGISPNEQPPNHYRLLGIELYESNAAVIENAADRQMAYVRSAQTGQHQAESQRLLQEIVVARNRLLDAETRAAYDRELKRQSSAATAEVVAPPVTPRPKAAKPVWASLPFVIALPLLGLFAIVGGLIWLANPPSNRQPEPNAKPIPGNQIAQKPSTNGSTPQAQKQKLNQRQRKPASQGKKKGKAASTKKKVRTKQKSGAKEQSSNKSPASKPLTTVIKPGPPPRRIKQPVPNSLALETLSKEIAQTYRQQFLEAKTGAAQKAFAQELLKAVAREKSADRCYALLQVALEMATAAADIPLSMSVVAKLREQFILEEFTLAATAVQQLMTASRNPAFHTDLFPLIEATTEQVIAQDNYSLASKLAEIASESASRSRNTELSRAALIMVRMVKRLQDAFLKLGPKPQQPTPDQCTEWGKFYCLAKRDWQRGIPLLARGTDKTLAKLAQEDSHVSPDAAQRGDDWLAYSKTVSKQEWGGRYRFSAERRAIRWYWRGLRDPRGAKRDHITKQLKRLKQFFSLSERVWQKGKPTFKLTHTADGFCFLTGVGGAYNGLGEEIRLVPMGDRRWHFAGRAAQPIHGIAAQLRLGPRRLHPRHREYMWQRGMKPIRMIHKSKGFCFLTSIGGQFLGGGESVRVYVGGDGYWYLGGSAAQSLIARAVAVRLVGLENFNTDLKEHVWTRDKGRVKMIHSQEGFCFLSGINGALNGGGESIALKIGPDGYWYMTGKAARFFVAHAISVRILDAWP